MANSLEFTSSLQESVLAALGYDDVNGKIIANLVDPSMFEGDYQIMAERCIQYFRTYGRAPGRSHIRDILSDILDNHENKARKTFLRMIEQMAALAGELNPRFVLDRVNKFVRLQTFKKTTIEVAERLQSGQEDSIRDVEELWHRILKADSTGFNPGMPLTDVDRLLNFMRNQHAEFLTGIPILDERLITPARGTADLFIASTGMGKTWWLVNLGKQALLQRKRVLHVTLEMGEEEVAARYMQAFFAIGQRTSDAVVTEFDRDDDGKVHGLSLAKMVSDFNLASGSAREEIMTYIGVTGNLFHNIRVKQFATGTLTVPQLEAYLDTLERTQRFVPDIVLLDYLGLMGVDPRDYRLGLGRVFKAVRGLAMERNFALSTAHQANRTGALAQRVDVTDISEDWSLNGTADQVFTFTSTELENTYNLGRLFVGKARSQRDKFSLVISRNYAFGQFCVDSYLSDDEYWDMLKEFNSEGSRSTGRSYNRRSSVEEEEDEWEDD